MTPSITLVTDANVPSETTLDITIHEDTNQDGTSDNSATQSIDDGTNSYTFTGFETGSGNDYWLDIVFGQVVGSSFEQAASLNSAELVIGELFSTQHSVSIGTDETRSNILSKIKTFAESFSTTDALTPKADFFKELAHNLQLQREPWSRPSLWISKDDGALSSIYRVTRTGSQISSFAAPSYSPRGVDVTRQNKVWHADEIAERIYQFDYDGSQISSFDSASSEPYGIGITENNCLWIAQRTWEEFHKHDQDGSIVDSFSVTDKDPHGMDVDRDGCLWVGFEVSNSDHCTYKMNESGSILYGFQNPTFESTGVFGTTFYTQIVTDGLAVDNTYGSLWMTGDVGESLFRLNRSGSLLEQHSLGFRPKGMGTDTFEQTVPAPGQTKETNKFLSGLVGVLEDASKLLIAHSRLSDAIGVPTTENKQDDPLTLDIDESKQIKNKIIFQTNPTKLQRQVFNTKDFVRRLFVTGARLLEIVSPADEPQKRYFGLDFSELKVIPTVTKESQAVGGDIVKGKHIFSTNPIKLQQANSALVGVLNKAFAKGITPLIAPLDLPPVQPSKPQPETVSVSDEVRKNTKSPLLPVLGILSNFSNRTRPVLNVLSGASEIIGKQAGATKPEVSSVIENFRGGPKKLFSEATGLVTDVLKTPGKTVDSVAGTIEEFGRILDKQLSFSETKEIPTVTTEDPIDLDAPRVVGKHIFTTNPTKVQLSSPGLIDTIGSFFVSLSRTVTSSVPHDVNFIPGKQVIQNIGVDTFLRRKFGSGARLLEITGTVDENPKGTRLDPFTAVAGLIADSERLLRSFLTELMAVSPLRRLSPGLTFTETMNPLDTLLTEPTSLFKEVIASVDSRRLGYIASKTETVATSPFRALGAGLSFVETEGVSTAISWCGVKLLSKIVSPVDDLVPGLQAVKSFAEVKSIPTVDKDDPLFPDTILSRPILGINIRTFNTSVSGIIGKLAKHPRPVFSGVLGLSTARRFGVSKVQSEIVGLRRFIKRSLGDVLALLEQISPVDEPQYGPRFALSSIPGVEDTTSLSPIEFLSVVLGLSTLRQMMPGSTRVEAVNPGDVLGFGFFRTFTELAGVIEDTNLGPIQAIAEALGGIENISELGVVIPFTESVGGLETIRQGVTKALSSVSSAIEGLVTGFITSVALSERKDIPTVDKDDPVFPDTILSRPILGINIRTFRLNAAGLVENLSNRPRPSLKEIISPATDISFGAGKSLKETIEPMDFVRRKFPGVASLLEMVSPVEEPSKEPGILQSSPVGIVYDTERLLRIFVSELVGVIPLFQHGVLRGFAESIATIDDSTRMPSVRESVQVSTIQEFTSAVQKAFSRVVGVQPLRRLSVSFGLSSVAGIVDARSSAVSVSPSEIAGTIQRLVAGLLTQISLIERKDIPTVSKSGSQIVSRPILGINIRTFRRNTVGVLDSIRRGVFRSVSEVLSVANPARFGVTIPKTETIGIVDSIIQAPSIIRTAVSGVSSSIGRLLLTVTRNQLVSVSDIRDFRVTKAFSPVLGIRRRLRRILGGIVSALEVLSPADEPQKQPSKLRIQNIGGLDKLVSGFVFDRIFSEVSGVVDRSLTGAVKFLAETVSVRGQKVLSTALQRAFVETSGLSDTVTPLSKFVLAIKERPGLVDTTGRIFSGVLSLGETSSLDAKTSIFAAYVRGFTETAGLKSLFSTPLTFLTELTETAGLQESLSESFKGFKRFAEVQSVDAEASVFGRFFIELADVSGIREAPSTLLTALADLKETLSVVSEVVTGFDIIREFTETVGVDDFVDAITKEVLRAAEVLSVTETQTFFITISRTVTAGTSPFFQRVIDFFGRATEVGKNFVTISRPKNLVELTRTKNVSAIANRLRGLDISGRIKNMADVIRKKND